MNVAQLFHKLRVISNIEIVVPLLPEMLGLVNQTPGHSLLQRLQSIGQPTLFCPSESRRISRWPIQAVLWLEWGSTTAGRVVVRFAEQQVHMLRHDHVPVNLKPETVPDTLQG
jgi:hypothetical protein